MAEESQEIKKGFSKFLEKFSADNAEKRITDKASIDAQKVELAQLKTTIESQGGVAAKNAEYNKQDLAVKLKDLALQKRSATNKGAKEEIEKERQAAIAKQGTLLQRIAGGISGIFGNMKEGVKAAGKGFMSILKGTLMAGLFIAVAKFLQSPLFGQIIDFITNTLIPKLMFFYDAFFGPNGGFINGITALFSDDSGIGAIVLGLAAVGIIFAGFKIFRAFTAIKTGVIATKAFLLTTGTKLNGMFGPKGKLMAGIGKAFSLLGGAFALIGKGLLAIKVFFSATLLPAISAFMIPLLPIIAIVAAVVAVGYAIYEGFLAFQKRFEETGSIIESIKAAFSTFVGTILGIIPTLIQKLIVFVSELFGFDEFAKKIGSVDIMGVISEKIESIIDDITKFIMGILDFDFKGFFMNLIPTDGVLGKIAGGITSLLSSGDKKENKKPIKERLNTQQKEFEKSKAIIMEKQKQGMKDFEKLGGGAPTEKTIDQMNKSAISKSMGGDASAPAIAIAPTIQTNNNQSNQNISTSSSAGNPDPTIQFAFT